MAGCKTDFLCTLLMKDYQYFFLKQKIYKGLKEIKSQHNARTTTFLAAAAGDRTIHWRETYPVDSAIHLLNKCGLSQTFSRLKVIK